MIDNILNFFEGHTSQRLIPVFGWMPLVCLALTPIMIATSMTNPFFSGVRNSSGVPAATKWMTLKWRIILMTIALITLVFYNFWCWDYVDISSYTMLERFSDAVPLAEESGGWLEVIYFYILTPIASAIFFVLSLIQVLCSRKVIRSESPLFALRGEYGLAQLASFMFFFMGMCITASGTSDKVLADEDFIILCNFYFASSFLWIFRKTNYDFKKDFGSEDTVWESTAGKFEDEISDAEKPDANKSIAGMSDAEKSEYERIFLDGNSISDRHDS